MSRETRHVYKLALAEAGQSNTLTGPPDLDVIKRTQLRSRAVSRDHALAYGLRLRCSKPGCEGSTPSKRASKMGQIVAGFGSRKVGTSLLKVGGYAIRTTEDATQTDRAGERGYEVGSWHRWMTVLDRIPPTEILLMGLNGFVWIGRRSKRTI